MGAEGSSHCADSHTIQVSRAVASECMWLVEKIEISGGFLPGLSVNIPRCLTCIIGPRGSGKSTLAEALRFAVCGMSAAPKPCVDLIQANLAGGALVTITALAEVRVATHQEGTQAATRPSDLGRTDDHHG
jgi:hypothetical protein